MESIVIIPAYRPPATLPAFLEELRSRGFLRILLVDDGSGKEFQSLFEQCEKKEGTILLRHDKNMGKGEALKTAFRYCLTSENTDTVILTADCDGQHCVDDIEKMFYTVTVGKKNAIFLGARKFDKTMPRRSRLGNKVSSFLINRICKTELTDTQTGLRGFYQNMLPFLIGIPGKRYEYETNMLILAAKHGITIETAEIRSIYIDRNRKSHYRPVIDSLRVTFALTSHHRKGI